MNLADKLKKLRKEAGLTQEDLGKIIGVTTSMVGMYETGARKPSYDVLVKIADYFRISTDYLLGRSEKQTSEDAERFPVRLKRLRKEKGVTLEQMAMILNSTDASISRYENNKQEPKIGMIKSIADYFGVTTDYLLGYSNSRTNEINQRIDLLTREIIRQNHDIEELEKKIASLEGRIPAQLKKMVINKDGTVTFETN